MKKNFGLILVNPPITQWVFGGVSGLVGREVLRFDRNWDEFISTYEAQSFPNFDTYGCVTFSALNAIEIIWKYRFGFEKNFSDRFTAKMSGTTSAGNTFYNVSESIRNDGLVEQESYVNTAPTRAAFYQPVSEELKAEGQEFKKKYEVTYEYVPSYPESLWDALQYGPIQVAGYAWPRLDSDGHFVKTDNRANHGFVIYGGEFGKYFKAFDHYNLKYGDDGRKILNWDYRFWAGLVYDIKERNDVSMRFNEGVLYQLVTPPGGFYLLAAGQLRRDDLAKIQASFIVRNGGSIAGKVDTITADDLEGVKVYNLKGEEVEKW